MATEIKTLQQAILHFADYENCHKAVMAIRWPDSVVRCPTCGSENVTYMENARRWKCYAKHAKPQFSLKVGTIFEDSPIGLEKWLPALWLLTNCKNGISRVQTQLIKARMPRRQRGTGLRSSSERVCRSALRCA